HPIRFARGIEVGHVFKLGTKYSDAMRATFLDRDGKEKTMIMGCYGIGVGRTAAACIEQNNDADGIIWPMTIAPYHVIISPVNMKADELSRAAEQLYEQLTALGVEVILDDRDERAGVKFKDADLIGIPLRVTMGPKKLAEGTVELRFRKNGEVREISLGGAAEYIADTVAAELRNINEV
ncbi:MAG: proline--tRNA ligase, partial [Deltaproteobacteria bacterium]|nr:proline--tRNA ligase [Deltaproteobacteria bacterium]